MQVEPERIPLDRLTWARWRRVVLDVMRSEVGGRVKLLFGALLALLLAINGLNVVNSYVGRDFMTAIEQRSMSGFVTLAALYIGVFAASTVAAVIYRFSEERLGLLWRHWMTRSLVDYYLHDAAYYRLRERAEVRNPDQRIADDVRTFTATTLSLLLVWLNGTFTIVAFSGVLWSISPLLFAVAVGYAALGSGLTLAFGRPLLWLNYHQSDREASFRAELVHLRENAESVAFLHREDRIRERLFARVDALVDNLKRIIGVNRNLGFFTTGYNYLIQLIPILIVAPLFIRGQVEFGVISQSAMAFSHLIGAFSLVVSQFQQISSYAVVMARLSALGEGVERLEKLAGRIEIDESGEEVEYRQLSLRSPHDGRVLVASLSARLAVGTRTLVTGDEEASIARAVPRHRRPVGLWRGPDRAAVLGRDAVPDRASLSPARHAAPGPGAHRGRTGPRGCADPRGIARARNGRRAGEGWRAGGGARVAGAAVTWRTADAVLRAPGPGRTALRSVGSARGGARSRARRARSRLPRSRGDQRRDLLQRTGAGGPP